MRLRYIERSKDRQGRPRYHFRKGDVREALPPDYGSVAFLKTYTAFLAGSDKPRSTATGGTLASLVASYKRSEAYRHLRATTRQGYDSRMSQIERDHGHRAVAGLNRERIDEIILQPFADRPGSRLDVLKKLRILIRHAIDLRWLQFDPSAGIRRPRGGEIRAWTEEEIVIFEAHWPPGSRQRAAFALHLFTGQRRSDVHRMVWGDIGQGRIRVATQKTGAKLLIPLHRDLLAVLALTPRRGIAIVPTETGAERTVDGWSQFMRDAIGACGLPLDCQPHGLRKAAGRRLAEAGCTAHEIMSILGHKTLAEAERYTREADQGRLARSAIGKLEDG